MARAALLLRLLLVQGVVQDQTSNQVAAGYLEIILACLQVRLVVILLLLQHVFVLLLLDQQDHRRVRMLAASDHAPNHHYLLGPIQIVCLLLESRSRPRDQTPAQSS